MNFSYFRVHACRYSADTVVTSNICCMFGLICHQSYKDSQSAPHPDLQLLLFVVKLFLSSDQHFHCFLHVSRRTSRLNGYAIAAMPQCKTKF